MNWRLWIVRLALVCSSFAEAGTREAEPRAVIGRTGESAILGCDLLKPDEATPPLYVIEWVRFGFLLPIFIKFGLYSPRVDPEYVGRVRIQEGASLWIEQLRAEDQGWYECRVLFLDRPNSDDEFQNGTWIHLTVNFPPTFQETPPAFIEVQDQKSLTLTCSAAGNPQPVVTWKRDNQAIEGGDKVQVKNGTLVFASVERASAGAYTCHATSEEGAITHTTRLLVQGPPVIVVPPQNVTVNLTQDAFLACQAEAYPANLTYSWFQGNTNVFHLSHLQSRIRVLVDGSLLVQKTVPEDSGQYTCVPSNGLRRSPSASAFLTVLYPAQVIDMPPETLLPIGMQGTIRCPNKANPPLLFINWTKDGQPLELGKLPGWSTTPDGAIVIATSNDNAVGLYTCTPYNSYGSAGSSAPTRVLLKDPPAFSLRPKEEYFQEVGRELLIPCTARGDPLPVISWTKMGSKGLANAQVDKNNSLVLRPLTKEQHGLWECAANNGVARISTATTVYVLGTSPHTVANVSVLPLQQAVNITWEPGFDGGYFQRFSIWYTPLLKRFNRPHHDWVSLPVPVGASHVLVENLQPDTGYQFSVLAQNKLGSGPFSEIVTTVPLGFPTNTMPPNPSSTTSQIFLSPPQSLMANETTRGVLLLWEPPFQFSVALTGYTLELRQDQGGWEVLDGSISSSETQLLVPGLIKDAFYEFRLVAFAGSYISDPSNTVNVSTIGMEVYPSRTQLPELLPQPVLAGVIGGVCFLSTAVIFSTMAACIMNQRRAARLRKRRQDPPTVFSPNKKLLPSQNSTGTASPDSVVKMKFQASPYQSLRRSLLWGEKVSTNLGLNITSGSARNSSRYTLYESHVGEPLPLERICRGPDGRFVVQSEAPPRERLAAMLERYSLSLASSESSLGQLEPYLQVYSPPRPEEPVWQKSVPLRPKSTSRSRREAKASGYRQGRYFDYSSSSPTEEAEPLCIVNVSPVATMPYGATKQRAQTTTQSPEAHVDGPATAASSSSSPTPSSPTCSKPPSSQAHANTSAQSGILQYLSLPFFKEMNVDGDWPPEEEEEEEEEEEDEEEEEEQPSKPALHEALGSTELTGLGDEDRTVCPAYMDTQANLDPAQVQALAKSLLRLPHANTGPAKAAFPGTSVCPSYLSSFSEMRSPKEPGPWLEVLSSPQPPMDSRQAELAYTAIPSEPHWLHAAEEPPESLPPERHKSPVTVPPAGPPAEKLPRGSLTSQSSGRGSVSFLRPPSLAPSLAGSYLSSPFAEMTGWQSGSAGEECRFKKDPSVVAISKRRNTSVDENYEWDSEFALESDLLDALQLYRSGNPKRPVSTIAAQELEKQSSKTSSESSSSPSNSQSVGALDGSSSPVPLPSPEERCAALREEFMAYRRRREATQQRRQKLGSDRKPGDERFEQATLL
ncbi:protein turtle homolog A isoform X1 [Zootoca vivipara]|uniref:protein turtle homolog A isoform X1 n=2 Tax=Zootoca vivipara TaxID=8524 RepID=UPI00293B9FD8|nr:protein turtle homolog A isoform X1 [Zootoca vivipara]XP_034954066.2 protein turtle homolog A isoform X1 [Zootoca vivipara]XP_034954067.2 protein turtle homolog A isoform X1 [Zootoca vivipara]